MSFSVPQGGDGQLELVPLLADLGGDGALAVAGDQVELVGPEAVERGAVLGAAGGADAPEPVGGGPQVVAVVVEQGVLGGESGAGPVELVGPAAGGEEGFEERDLAVLVEVGGAGRRSPRRGIRRTGRSSARCRSWSR